MAYILKFIRNIKTIIFLIFIDCVQFRIVESYVAFLRLKRRIHEHIGINLNARRLGFILRSAVNNFRRIYHRNSICCCVG